MRAGLRVSQGGEGLNSSPWSNSVPKVGANGAVVDDEYRLFPIPTAARQTNRLLTQDPGW